MKFSNALASLAVAYTSYAQLLIDHPTQVSNTRIDPLDRPGKLATQVRSVLGGDYYTSNWNAFSPQVSNCTTADIAQDKSNYVAPLLYFAWKNGTFSAVPNGGGGIALLPGPADKAITPWPVGFRSFGGSPDRRTYNSTTTSNSAISYSCLGGDVADSVGIFPASTSCPKGWSIKITMPQCWDGKNLWLPKAAHVKYPSSLTDGACPVGWDTLLPGLQVIYNYMEAGEQETLGFTADNGQFVLSNGDPTGYSFHAEFMNGWDQDLLQSVIDECLLKDVTDAAKCAPLIAAPKTNRKDDFRCTTIGQVASEPVGDNYALDQLPGCNPVWDGKGKKPSCDYDGSDVPIVSVDPDKAGLNLKLAKAAGKAKARRHLKARSH